MSPLTKRHTVNNAYIDYGIVWMSPLTKRHTVNNAYLGYGMIYNILDIIYNPSALKNSSAKKAKLGGGEGWKALLHINYYFSSPPSR